MNATHGKSPGLRWSVSKIITANLRKAAGYCAKARYILREFPRSSAAKHLIFLAAWRERQLLTLNTAAGLTGVCDAGHTSECPQPQNRRNGITYSSSQEESVPPVSVEFERVVTMLLVSRQRKM